MYKAFKYRIYPSKSQEVLLAKHFGSNRLVWNHFLSKHSEEYRSNTQDKIYNTYNKKANQLKSLKKEEDYSFLNEISSQSLQQTLMHLDKSFKSFFKNPKQFKYPNFKSKKNRQSFSIPQHIKVNYESGITNLCKLGNIPTIFHRKIEGKIKSCTISKTPANSYYISILCEIDKPLPKARPVNEKSTVGIDLGIKDFLVTSSGIKIGNPKFLSQCSKKLKHHQKLLSKKQDGSKARDAQKLRVAKIHEQISNQRKDFLNKLSYYIVNDKQVNTIAVEDLSVKNMMKNHRLARGISDSSWSEFIRQLEYKCLWNGKTFYKIDKFYPSSKTCSACGNVHHELILADRIWVCPVCKKEHDRDINASLNIKRLCLEHLVPEASPEQVKQSSMEPLASITRPNVISQSYEVENSSALAH